MTWQTYVLSEPAELPKGPTDLSAILSQMVRVHDFDGERVGPMVECPSCRVMTRTELVSGGYDGTQHELLSGCCGEVVLKWEGRI